MYLNSYIIHTCVCKMDLSLLNGATIQIVGPSGCGKTYFTINLLSNANEIFEKPISHIYWLYGSEDGENGEIYDEFKNIPQKVVFLKGFQKGWKERLQSGDIVVIDDLFMEANKEKDFNNLFTKIARHRGVVVIFITQNLFQQGGGHRTRNLNVHYLVLFKNPRDSTAIDFVARQAFHFNSKFLVEAYEDATHNKPYGYIFIDFTQKCPDDFRVRTDIFNENGIVVYKQKRKD